MSATASATWFDANQRHLTAALAVVRAALERHTARNAGDPGEPAPSPEPADGQEGPPPALETLSAAFGLSPFERDVLLLCAGVELVAAFSALCAAAHGDPRRGHATFGLALAALPGAHWSALTPPAPLRRWRLVELGGGDSLTQSPLRIDERVLHYLAGVSYLDERLQGLLESVSDPGELPPSHRGPAERLAALWSRADSGRPRPMVQLCGGDRAGKPDVAARACATLGLRLQALRAADVPPTAAERETLARLCEREAALNGAALLVDCHDVDGPERTRAALAFAESLQGLVILAAAEPLPVRGREEVTLDVGRPGAAEQLALWRRELGPAGGPLNGQIEAVVAQFDLGLSGIRAAGRAFRDGAGQDRGEPPGHRLWDACRAQARTRLDELAQRLEPAAACDDLVLPEPQRQLLREIAAHVRGRVRVYQDWGFAARGTRGLGISALFAGASGTGKTMAAEVLARQLRLDLYRIDLSAVVSKYIGETEKNLRRVFDAAEGGGAILLFDEADALFGKRSEVKDSHDRHANIEVGYLLQRMEAYRGLAVLTTNLKNALDPAFLRRLRFVVQFPFPDAAQRAEIWRRAFPPSAPTEGLDVARLARLNVAGGNIRNIALNAAFLAADAGEPVRMAHLLRAARGEYAKLDRTLTEAEIGGWA